MANHPIPDLSTLLSSAQIFSSNYPLPHIRAIHKALHAEIDDKQSRLRTQVGGSYRELLGTADTIVQMRGDMESVQATLGRMGGRCGRQVVKEKMDGLKKWDESEDMHNTSRREAARVKILEGCVLAVQKLLRREEKVAGRDTRKMRGGKVEEKEAVMSKGDKLLVAAKVCVLGRLLVKTFEREGIHTEASRTAVQSADRSLTVLRDRLLRCIDSVLVSVNEKLTPRSDLLKALSAYGLHTSSGARDTLRHFLEVRGSALSLSINNNNNNNWEGQQSAAVRTPKDILRRLSLYAKTLQDVQALTPNKLADALNGLKKKALLADDALRAIEGLRLDIYSRWCGDEIRYYTPFIRHDDLQAESVNGLLSEWAPVHRDVFIDDLDKTVKSMSEFKAIVDLRTSVLRLWIAESSRVRYDFFASKDDNDDSSSEGIPISTSMFSQIRSTINNHLLSVIDTKVHKLRLVGSEASAALAAWREGTTDAHLSLWDPSAFSGIDLTIPSGGPSGGPSGSGGGGAAQQFASEVISRLYGRNDAVSKAVASYKSWFHVIDDVGSVVDQLRRQRWENDLEDEEDEEGGGGDMMMMMVVEDEETIEQRHQLLSREDPERLTTHLSASLVKAFAALDEHLTDLWTQQRDGPNNGQIAMYLLRLLRDIRSRLPDQPQIPTGAVAAAQEKEEDSSIKAFGLPTIPSLHTSLARTVLVSPVDEFVTVALARKTVVGRGLWEGSPELPTSPSPGMFRFLRSLSAAMAEAGADLWSPAAVRELKKEVRQEVCKVWLEAARGVLEEAERQERESGEKETSKEEGDEKKDDEIKKEGENGGEEGEKEDKVKEETDEEAKKTQAEEALVAKAEAEEKLQKQQQEEEEAEKANQQRRRDLFVQWLFDIIYLGIFLDGSKGDFNAIANTVFQHSGLDPGAKGRLVKAAQEYYKRTQLLFGLLTS
ncbi:hypothetical protein GE21DRAFT_4588 [Neurospora crassa]|uniref:Conserved oligomeric Golgi complex subunit 1 n=1 Tax=Neurospora crassa (strain ATCC 24698 / 74-OR23-1A / CBS 708.71 / DSM 1257 / FGSC 987) TaxID=367110 RepID=Q7RZT4_NEUCR|nr:hypothetical protein NCU00280 [Neurospora crassa OR74A]EAA28515.1 hypothetical protein NCU00280 [Neurospora crassa OR74A]KHE89623.1 hypothetical protein GE21DRAFT_4588 [Neurospora crassa]|eukprot:XP_957751.1 hypothetical protein NCU00280 [Neurospora crassa OR74A]